MLPDATSRHKKSGGKQYQYLLTETILSNRQPIELIKKAVEQLKGDMRKTWAAMKACGNE